MPLATLLDNRTLLVCLWMATFLMSLAFARTWKSHGGLRGAGCFSLAFLCGALSSLLFALVPATTPLLTFLNTVVGDTLVVCVYAFLLLGVERYLTLPHPSRLGWAIVAVSALLLFGFTHLYQSMLARIVVLGVSCFALRLLLAKVLLRHRHRPHRRTLAVVMLLYALLSFGHTLGTLLHGAPSDYMRSDSVQTAVLFANLVFVLTTGLLLFLMLNGELVYRIEQEAARDFVCGTLNRRGVERTLRAEMERSRRHTLPLSIALLDLDFFKQINDTRGHAAGDAVIVLVADAITDALRAYDHVGRFGGDEFLLILPNTLPAQATTVLKRIREDLARNLDYPITLSIGLTAMDSEGEEPTTLLARVDQALYDAKHSGRNCTRERIAAQSQTQNQSQPHALSA